MTCVALFVGFGVGTSYAAKGGTDRPFKASGSGLGVVDPVAGTYVIDGTSKNSHLGRSTFHTEGALTGGNTITITAANGDKLVAIGTSATDAIFSGGTGRFQGASGTLTSSFTITPDPSDPTNPLRFELHFTQHGTISY
jgi:hypothetical protein